jgi:hypothetical protein
MGFETPEQRHSTSYSSTEEEDTSSTNRRQLLLDITSNVAIFEHIVEDFEPFPHAGPEKNTQIQVYPSNAEASCDFECKYSSIKLKFSNSSSLSPWFLLVSAFSAIVSEGIDGLLH